MTIDEIPPNVASSTLLAGAQFADAFTVWVEDGALDARQAAERMLARGPRWIDALLTLRNVLVAPFGLKTSGARERAPGGIIGIFPVVSETPERLVAGFDDRHLDFRVVIDVAAAGDGRRVTATTLVLTHNLLGRVYLATILPFHRLVTRALLRHAFLRP
jgi:Protein of unknown function (DUF2867)